MTNKLEISRELAERWLEEIGDSKYVMPETARRRDELRALLAAPVVERQEPVAYLDIGAGGYVDLGTDQPVEVLENLPYGRHMLGIIGTYGADGWQPSVKRPVSEIEPVAYAVFSDSGNIRIWSRSADVVEMISCQGGKVVPLYAEQPAPVAVALPDRKPITPGFLDATNRGWNACLDKVKELNQ